MKKEPPKRLFRVFFKGEDVHFESRQQAKAFVRMHGLKGVAIHRGPDHWKGQSDGTSVLTVGKKDKNG